MIISNVQKPSQPSQQKKITKFVKDLISNENQFQQQNIQQKDKENGFIIKNESPSQETIQKETPIQVIKQQNQTSGQTIFSRKPIISILEGIETVQSTNRKSLRSRQSANNSERNSIFGQTPDQKPLNQPKRHSISSFQTNGNLHTFQNGKIPKPSKDYYKCNSFAKIFYSHKIGLSRIFMLSQIYFRQILCFEICGALFLFIEPLQSYYIIGSSCGGYLIFKIYDYYVVKSLCKNGSGFLLKLINYVIWTCALSILILGILFYQPNNLICLQYYIPALILELFIVDPIKYVIIKNCLAEPRININKKQQNIK
ncbi:unnamed protein product [Paramecium sonneborni]|uniref:Transmembrane protein n=1 Tax=Paramecium sonneborni TaxID=65129 RepID=A0A8S1N618_9CILI|nr:unnamed protein product [Paramecium sonneborni]